MRTYDFSPLFRSSVGFDRLQKMMDNALRESEGAASYPPYDIEALSEDAYRITMAVAGFSQDDLSITSENNTLRVVGDVNREDDEQERVFLHHGIAGRAFERRFQLADHIKVRGADLENGLLHIDLEREVPEALKPRTIDISSTTAKAAALEDKAA